MAHEEFRQHGSAHKSLAHMVEEIGEVTAAMAAVLCAAGKTQRFGFDSYNPLLPVEQQETNEAWLRREMDDLKLAIAKFELEAGWK